MSVLALTVYFLPVVLLSLLFMSLLLTLNVSFSKFLNILLQCFLIKSIFTKYFSQIIYHPLRYFSEQILAVLAKNPLNTLIIVLEGIDGLIYTFVIAGLLSGLDKFTSTRRFFGRANIFARLIEYAKNVRSKSKSMYTSHRKTTRNNHFCYSFF